MYEEKIDELKIELVKKNYDNNLLITEINKL